MTFCIQNKGTTKLYYIPFNWSMVIIEGMEFFLCNMNAEYLMIEKFSPSLGLRPLSLCTGLGGQFLCKTCLSRIVPAGGKSLPYQLCFEQWPRAANMLAQNV